MTDKASKVQIFVDGEEAVPLTIYNRLVGKAPSTVRLHIHAGKVHVTRYGKLGLVKIPGGRRLADADAA